MIYDKIKVRFWSQLWRWQKGDGSIKVVCFFVGKYKTAEVLVHLCCW